MQNACVNPALANAGAAGIGLASGASPTTRSKPCKEPMAAGAASSIMSGIAPGHTARLPVVANGSEGV